MYSFDGTGFGANGVLFFSHRPLLSESVVSGGTAYSPLVTQPVDVSGINAYTVIDTTALFSLGADFPGTASVFHFTNYVSASGGSAGNTGGQWLHWGFPFLGTVSTPPAGIGAGLYLNNVFEYMGTFQYGSTGHNNCPFYLDLIAPGSGSVNTWKPAFWWLTASTPVVLGNNTDSSGQTARMGWLWQGVNVGGTTVASIPSPQLSWGTVTSAALNTSIGSCLTFLNNPPMLRNSTTSGQSVPDSANTILQFTSAPTMDNYNGWSTAVSHYTAQLPGLYLFCPTIVWGTTSSAGYRQCGLDVVAGGTTVIYMGSSYAATPVGPGVSGVGMTATAAPRVFNLHAGDTVAGVGYQNSGVAVPLLTSQQSRIMAAYLTQTAAAGTVLTAAAPDATFRWHAGALGGTALTAALNQHIGTDIQFLLNRPYFTGYQQAAQSGFANNSGFHQVTVDTLGAAPWGGNGDSYGGWSTAHTWYVSQLAGQYLVIADLYATAPVSGTVGMLTAGIFCSSSGSVTPAATPDQYQQVYYPLSANGAPVGAFAMGLYYLQPGEYVYPMLQAQGWGGNWGTFVSSSTAHTTYCQFSCFWVSG